MPSPLRLIATLLCLCALSAVDEPDFSHARGFYDSDFTLTITAPAGSVVYYTTDSEWPDSGSNGGSQSVDVPITTTTVVKAVAFAGADSSSVVAHTFVFAAKVVSQPANAKGTPTPPPDGLEPPSGWGSTKMESGATVASLKAQPVLSISLPMDELFDNTNGIMPNSPNEFRKANADPLGNDWERRGTAEMFTASGETIFIEHCGLRIAGATAGSHEKTPFALEFRGRYGTPVLEADLMQTGHVRRFDELRLDNQREDPDANMAQPTIVTLQQRANGMAPNTRRTHVYINGIYWGSYNLINRANEGNASEWMGRDKDHISYVRTQTFKPAWKNAMHSFGVVDDEDSWEWFQQIHDAEHYVDFAILAFLINAGGQINKEAMFVRNDQTGAGFRGYFWDLHGKFAYNGSGDTASAVSPGLNTFSPDTLGVDLNLWLGFDGIRDYSAFKRLFMDRVHRHFFNGGMLDSTSAASVIAEAAQGLADIWPAEYARWRGRSPMDSANATLGADAVAAFTDWLEQRPATTLAQLQNEGLYPETAHAPTFSPFGGTYGSNRNVTLGNPSGGELYYTTDGRDPADIKEELDPVTDSSVSITLNGSTHLRARTLVDETWSPLTETTFRIKENRSNLQISEIHYHPAFTDSDIATGLEGLYAEDNEVVGYRIDSAIDFDWGSDGVYPGFSASDQSVVWNGWIAADTTGSYRFRAKINGRATLRIDEAIVFDTFSGSDADTTLTGNVTLDAGKPVRIQLNYYPVEGAARCSLDWRPPAAGSFSDIPSTALRYEATTPEDYAFIELYNDGSKGIDLTGWSFTNGIRSTFSNPRVLAGGERLVLAANPRAFQRRYSSTDLAGAYAGSLSNDGDRLLLVDADGTAVLDVTYNDAGGWPSAADGAGSSLVYTGGDANSPDAWAASRDVGGNPGGADTPAGDGDIVVNEALTHTDPPLQDSIELHNPTGGAVDIGNWYLTDDKQSPKKWQIPSGTTIAPQGYVVFDEDDFGSAFQLSSLGDGAYVFAADGSGVLTGYSHGFAYPPAFNGVSFGRYVVPSTDEEQFVAQTTRSLGAENSGPKVGPIVFSEIQYHPAAGEVDFIELYNTSGSAVSLYDSGNGNPWRVRGTGFAFSNGDSIPAGGVALLVKDDPASFRSRHSVPASVPIFGPFSAKLDNGGERLELLQPDGPTVDGDGNTAVPEVPVEIVDYDDESPWPTQPDGTVYSLHRTNLTSHGNNVGNWQSAVATPGTVDGDPPSNQAPVVSAGGDIEAAPATATTLDGSVSDDGLPGGALAITWSKQSGPGTVSFADANSASTTATFSAVGTYVLRLSADDGDLSADDTVEVIVSTTNAAPTVSAGADDSVRWPADYVLAGSVDDDGLPSDDLTIRWRTISGPGSVNFTDDSDPATSVRFGETGTYVLELSADDTDRTTSDRVTITVQPAPALAIQAFGDEHLVDEVLAYSDQDETPRGWGISPDGNRISLTGNTWKRLPVSVEITADTIMRVTVDVTTVGEIQAIGVDDDNVHDNATTTFQVDGTDTWDEGDQRFQQEDSGRRTLDLPIGELFTGSITAVVLVNDDDGSENAAMTVADIAFIDPTTSRTIHVRIDQDGTVQTTTIQAVQSGSTVYDQETDEHTIPDLVREVDTSISILGIRVLAADG